MVATPRTPAPQFAPHARASSETSAPLGPVDSGSTDPLRPRPTDNWTSIVAGSILLTM